MPSRIKSGKIRHLRIVKPPGVSTPAPFSTPITHFVSPCWSVVIIEMVPTRATPPKIRLKSITSDCNISRAPFPHCKGRPKRRMNTNCRCIVQELHLHLRCIFLASQTQRISIAFALSLHCLTPPRVSQFSFSEPYGPITRVRHGSVGGGLIAQQSARVPDTQITNALFVCNPRVPTVDPFALTYARMQYAACDPPVARAGWLSFSPDVPSDMCIVSHPPHYCIHIIFTSG